MAVFCAGSCSNNTRTFVIWPHWLQEVETVLSTRTAQTHSHQQRVLRPHHHRPSDVPSAVFHKVT